MNGFDELALRFTLAAAHFLWVGALLVLGIYGVDRIFIRSSGTRHGWYLLGMIVMAVTFPICFLMVGWSSQNIATKPIVIGDEPVLSLTSVVEEIVTLEEGGTFEVEKEQLLGRVEERTPVLNESEPNRWQEVAPWAMGIYGVGLVVMLLRLTVSWWWGVSLRSRSEECVNANWTKSLAKMSEQIGLKISPALRWSREVASPVVIGFAKPVILLPVSLMTHLSMNQVEAVLGHELAHLRRRDPWALMMQRVVETVLFFHPLIWWVSRQLDKSREEACDDLVLTAGCERADYAEALMVCSELRLREKSLSPEHTMELAAVGRGKELLRQRVLRLLGNEQQASVRLGRMGWLVGLLVVSGLFCAAAVGTGGRDDLADFDFENPPSSYEKGVEVADRNQRFKVDGLKFSASDLQWQKEGWLRLPKEEQGPRKELFLNLGVSGGYEIAELRIFDHETRELLNQGSRSTIARLEGKRTTEQYPFLAERIGSTNWIRMKEAGGIFPKKIDVWMRLVTNKPGDIFVLRPQKGASMQINGSQLVVTEILAGAMSGKSNLGKGMKWDVSSATEKDRETTVNIENRGKLLSGRYYPVGVKKDGSRAPLNHSHFWDFRKMNSHAYFQLDVALPELERIELIPFGDRPKFFFNGLEVPERWESQSGRLTDEGWSDLKADRAESEAVQRGFKEWSERLDAFANWDELEGRSQPASIPEVLVEDEPGSGSWIVRESVEVTPAGLDAVIYYRPDLKRFWIQRDLVGSSQKTYYGSFEGDPNILLIPAGTDLLNSPLHD